MKKRALLVGIVFATLICFAGCETWPIAAARAAKKRTDQTGPLVGELENATGVDDPLGRQQGSIDQTADSMEKKADGVGSSVENMADGL